VRVKSFDEFNSGELTEASSSVFSFDFLGNLFTKGLDAFSDVLKGKVIAFLMEKLGISEGSIFSKLVQNFVETIPVADYYAILFKGKVSAPYLAPKAAQATLEFLQEKGVDGIADALGVSDKNGLLYRTISEALTNQTTQQNFKKSMENFFLQLFGGISETSVEDFQKSLSSSEKSQLSNSLVQAAKSQGVEIKDDKDKDGVLNNFFSNLNTMNQANQAQVSTTSGENILTSLLSKQN
jgi:hypothetical protein